MKIHRLWLLVLAALIALAAPVRAGVTVSVRPGGWSDVVKAPDGFRFVRATQAAVVTERVDGGLVWQTSLPEPILYLRAAVDAGGDVRAIAQGNQSGLAYVISASGVTSLGPSFGQNATAIWWSTATSFAYFVQTSPTTYSVFNSAGCGPCVVTMAATSQGFRDIQPDGKVRLGDDFRTGVFNGRRLWEFSQRDGVTVGQCDPAGICAAVDGKTFTILKGFAFEPHVAPDGDTFAVATRYAGGAALILVTPPYPPADVTTTEPPVDPPTDHNPPPPPPPAQGMPDRKQVLVDLRKQYPALLNQQQAGELMARLAFTLRAEGFGLFRKDGGNNCPVPNSAVKVSCDILLHKPSSTWCDVLGQGPDVGESGPSTPTWCAGDPGDMTNFFAPPDPGGIVVPPPPPPVDPALGARVAALEAKVSALEGKAAGLLDQLAAAQRALDAAEGRLNARIDGIKPIDLPALQAAIDAALAGLEVVGRTGTAFGHQHGVKLAVTRK